MSKLEKNYIEYVRSSVDKAVENTGFPILGKILQEVGIATRQQLRILEKKGHLKSIMINSMNGGVYSTNGEKRGTILKAYYTERLVPSVLEKAEQVEEA